MIRKNIFIFCKEPEKIENYEQAIADTKHVWHCHHRKEITEMIPVKTLKESGMYFDVGPEDLIFLKPGQHSILHNTNRNLETREKISKALTGRSFTKEHRNKLSKFAKTRTGSQNPNFGNRGESNPLFGSHQTKEHREKIANSRKGKHWFNNGVELTFCAKCPEGFVEGWIETKGSL